ncbi:MAG TPA: YaaR family protein [Symbiobacteriaceae bacterium]|nr:YaaR family protein [Symbiobacteriaceae bacterium]
MPMERIRVGTDLAQAITARDRADRPAQGATPGAFRAQLAQAHVGQLNERIDKALADIDDLGTRLGQTLSMADLKRYRQAIAGLMRDLTGNMVEVRTQMEWDSQAWEHRTLVTVRKVNEELEKLTEMVLAQEQDRLGILAKIGEIKGMLLDVRM